jgi:hypothetical protein
MQNPDGEYELDRAQPAQRAVARQLMVINRKLGSRNITACKVGEGEEGRKGGVGGGGEYKSIAVIRQVRQQTRAPNTYPWNASVEGSDGSACVRWCGEGAGGAGER